MEQVQVVNRIGSTLRKKLIAMEEFFQGRVNVGPWTPGKQFLAKEVSAIFRRESLRAKLLFLEQQNGALNGVGIFLPHNVKRWDAIKFADNLPITQHFRELREKLKYAHTAGILLFVTVRERRGSETTAQNPIANAIYERAVSLCEDASYDLIVAPKLLVPHSCASLGSFAAASLREGASLMPKAKRREATRRGAPVRGSSQSSV